VAILALDHVNIHTTDLEKTRAFFTDADGVTFELNCREPAAAP
jgi:catechol 2,3-dioxygenase-like lactoylglutathione lyase family enzyme